MPATRAGRFLLGLTTGCRLLHRHAVLDYARDGRLRRAAEWVAAILNAALVAYLALFPALFAVVMRRGSPRFGARALVAAPLVWVATELGRTYILTGFPWVLLGYSQVEVLPIAQLASLFGVYGVSALVAAVSAAAANVVVA